MSSAKHVIESLFKQLASAEPDQDVEAMALGGDILNVRILRVVPLVAMPTGNFRSFPAEVGSTSPLIPTPRARQFTHPKVMSLTVDLQVLATEPGNDSSLALAVPLESQPDLEA